MMQDNLPFVDKQCNFLAFAATPWRREVNVFGSFVRLSVRCPSVNKYAACRDFCSLVDRFQLKLAQIFII